MAFPQLLPGKNVGTFWLAVLCLRWTVHGVMYGIVLLHQAKALTVGNFQLLAMGSSRLIVVCAAEESLLRIQGHLLQMPLPSWSAAEDAGNLKRVARKTSAPQSQNPRLHTSQNKAGVPGWALEDMKAGAHIEQVGNHRYSANLKLATPIEDSEQLTATLVEGHGQQQLVRSRR